MDVVVVVVDDVEWGIAEVELDVDPRDFRCLARSRSITSRNTRSRCSRSPTS